jgi:hypothetical protein
MSKRDTCLFLVGLTSWIVTYGFNAEALHAQSAQVPLSLDCSLPDSNIAVLDAARTYAREAVGENDALYPAFVARGIDLAKQQGGCTGFRGLRELSGPVAPAAPRVQALDHDERYLRNFDDLLLSAIIGVRVFNGQETDNYNSAVALTNNSGGLCSGVLVERDVVLTAAHCYCNRTADRIVLGPRLEQQPEIVFDIVPGSEVMMMSCPTNPSDNSAYHGKDFAFLRVRGGNTSQLAPTRIASADMLDAAQTASIRVVGYGLDHNGRKGIRQMADVAVASKRCRGVQDASAYGCIKDKELVAAMPSFARDTCRGDSGGPAFVSDYQNPSWFYLAVVTSRGINDDPDCGPGGIYTLLENSVIELAAGANIQLRIGRN